MKKIAVIFASVLMIVLFSLPSFAANVILKLDSSNGSSAFNVTNSSSTTIASIDSTGKSFVNGYVGIGTSSPTSRLTVSGSVEISGTNNGIKFPDGTIQTTASSGGASSQWVTSGSNIYYNNGNVGIKATNPTATLEVAGRAKIQDANYNTFVTGGTNSTPGSYNTAMGYNSLPSGTSGSENIAIGVNTLQNNSSGANNVAMGYNTLQLNQGGAYNTAIGYDTLYTNVSGGNNVGLGAFALSLTTAGNNVAVGYASGQYNTSGTGNVYLGYYAGPGSSSSRSNELYIANAGGTPLIYGKFNEGNVGIGTSAPTATFEVNGGMRSASLATGWLTALSPVAVWGTSSGVSGDAGVRGYSLGYPDGVQGINFGAGTAVVGGSNTGIGVYGTSNTGIGVYGSAPTAASFNGKIISNGSVASGTNAIALGTTTSAGNYSTAMGRGSTASGDYSTAIGWVSTASGAQSTAFGNNAVASGTSATAMGEHSAAGNYSTGGGYYSNAWGDYATSFGNSSAGNYASSMGFGANANANYSMALGTNTYAGGIYSTAMGSSTYATGNTATAMGVGTTASGSNCTAMGNGSSAGTSSENFAEGYQSIASGGNSVAMGYQSTASGARSLAVGYQCNASQNVAVALGANTQASQGYAFAAGGGSVASGYNSVAMCDRSTASNSCSVAFGSLFTNDQSYSVGIGNGNMDICLKADGNSWIHRDSGSGYLGIGTTAPTHLLEMGADDAYKPNGGSWGNLSDVRLKKNIKPLGNALDRICKLRGVAFEWINPDDHGGSNGTQGGFIAQEVEKTFPSWVKETSPTGKDINLVPKGGRIKGLALPFEYDALVVESIKELKAENDSLKQEIVSLKKTVLELKSRVEK
ncbi:MAG TPA: tail fiber domain-containing protein [Candidatus Omnitrophota bacterium]|nr:tail fiber domain-containing protein [Candidatus Omnitrophota bacterium]